MSSRGTIQWTTHSLALAKEVALEQELVGRQGVASL